MTTRLRFSLALTLVLAVLCAGPLLAQAAPPDIETQFNLLVAGLLGLGSTLFTNIGKRLVTAIFKVDTAVTNFYKKAQPVIALVLGMFVLPFLANRLPGIELPTAEVLANAPLGSLTFIGLRELYLHFFGEK